MTKPTKADRVTAISKQLGIDPSDVKEPQLWSMFLLIEAQQGLITELLKRTHNLERRAGIGPLKD